MKSLQCKQCGSVNFEKIKGGYKCKFCGTEYYTDFVLYPKFYINPSQKKLSLLIFIIILTMSAVVSFFLLYNTSSSVVIPSHIPIQSSNNASEVKPIETFGDDHIEKEKVVKGELYNLYPNPDSIGNIYFIGLFKNTGEAPIGHQSVSILLLSKSGEKVSVGSGYTFQDMLYSGEETHIKILVQNAKPYNRYETKYEVEAVIDYRLKMKKPNLKIRKSYLRDGSYKSYYTVAGEVENTDTRVLKYVNIGVAVYGKDNKLLGFNDTFIDEKSLKPGEYSLFSVDFYSVAEKPSKFKIETKALTDN